MKHLLALFVGLAACASPLPLYAQGTAFTYQGRLNDGTGLASGSYDLRFTIYDASGGGSVVAGPLTNSPTGVTNGLFTVTLDFGAGVFTGADRWLEIAARTNGGGGFTALSPRQHLTPAPYAIYTSKAGNAANVTGSFGGDVSGTQGSTVVASVGGYVAAAVASGASAANAATSVAMSGTIVKRDGSGNFSAANIAASFTGNGGGLTNLTMPAGNLTGTITGSQIAPASIGSTQLNTAGGPLSGQLLGYNGSALAWFDNAASGSWSISGNAGTSPGSGNFIGTTDNQPLELRVNGNRALRLQGGSSPNIIGGSVSNAAYSIGGVIGGGGSVSQPNIIVGKFGTIAGGTGNLIGDESIGPSDNAFVGGGRANASLMLYSAIVGGRFNTNVGFNAFIGGGYQNFIQQQSSVVAGGFQNSVLYGPGVALTIGTGQVIGGGTSNTIASDSPNAVIVGGLSNEIRQVADIPTDGAFIGAGQENTNRAAYGFLGGGIQNSLLSGAGVIGGGARNFIDHDADGSLIAGGTFNNVAPQSKVSTISGGNGNLIDHDSKWNSIGGGQFNGVGTFSLWNAIGGGQNNYIGPAAFWSVIGGGMGNTNLGSNATIPGGSRNFTGAGSTFAAGYRAKALHGGAFVWADTTEADFSSATNDVFLIRATNGVAINTNDPGGAALNVAGAVRASVFQGDGSGLAIPAANISGVVGLSHLPAGLAMLDGGSGQFFTGQNTFAGPVNIYDATTTLPDDGTLHIGGYGANGDPKLVKFGDGDFCYLGENGADDRMELRAGQFFFNVGSVGIGTNAPQQRLHVIGNILATGTITPNSDRNAKTDFASVDPAAVLEQVARLPIQQWRFKTEPETVKHVGPMAQDFHAAFGLGEIPTAIATVDADGVALAAIQGLNRKVEDLNGELKRRDAENAELKTRLERLERLLNSRTGSAE